MAAPDSQTHRTLSKKEQAIYDEHLKYEYGNRGRAYIGMAKMAQYSKGSDREAFYKAYYDLEVLNQQILDEMKVELDVDYKANIFTRGGLTVLAYTSWRFISPEQLIDIIVPYIPKLQQLESLAQPHHKAFFSYIVAQEKLQLEACFKAQEESWDSGAAVIRNFLPRARAELERLTSVNKKES